ncbi:MAG: hypothetical protein IK130_10230 [Oscillospiraceae bacterium]|nr:hypothetical protein [Oscillospiraceae bacterium]
MANPFTDDFIEIHGNTDVFIDRCRRLTECSDVLMMLEIRGLRVAVWGRDMTADDFSVHGLHIRGEILSVELSPAGGVQ